jgi:Transcriptional regulator containing an amidase domain and an AraC-type DNA-binding HTH domain
MKKIIILAFDGALASAITGVVDLFAMAGVSWNRIQKQNVQRLFQVKIASQHGQAVQCINGIKLYADLAFSEITDADIIIVPTIGAPILDVLAQNAALIELLKTRQLQSGLIAGNCTGNFFLAEAGLLDGKQATTHWGFQQMFRERYPLVN